MSEILEWYAAVRGNLKSVLVAVGGAVAVFGFDFSPGEQAGVAEGVDSLVASLAGIYATFNVLVYRVLAAFKADPDIDTGPTTPGPNTSVEV